MGQEFAEYQTDVLFLLMGTNPLPNYVAACLLVKPSGTVVLLHSKNTTAVAERVAERLRSKFSTLNTKFYTVPEADGPAIALQVGEAAQFFKHYFPDMTVGLHYTGGTKPMAAYCYRVIYQLFPKTVFSYLDARTLRMVLDPGGGPTQYLSVDRRHVSLSLEKMADLHDYKIQKPTGRQLRHPQISEAIVQIHLADGMKPWKDWQETLFREDASLVELSQCPVLAPVMKAFDNACGGTATASGVASALGFLRLQECGKYFKGEWFEEWTFEALLKANEQSQLLDDRAVNLNITKSGGVSNFEIDVAATIGYQLFVVSCIATSSKQAAKYHLFEVYSRARQLGGDEARFALVNLCDDKHVNSLQLDVTEEWDAAGKIRVFGRSHLRDLSGHLGRWLREANQEI